MSRSRLLPLAAGIGALCMGGISSRSQAQPNPSIRGVVIGVEYSMFNPYGGQSLGNGTSWWFGYRPDIPQAGGASVPASYGVNGIDDGGFPNADDWPNHLLHPLFSQQLPLADHIGRPTIYLTNPANPGGFPGISGPVGTITSSMFSDGSILSYTNNQWGGFFGVLKGSAGEVSLNGAPWSSSGADFGNPTSINNTFQASNAAVNFYIYDLNGVTPAVVSGKLMYNLQAPYDAVGNPTGYKGRIALKRKAFAAQGMYNFGHPNPDWTVNNAFIIQGTWELSSVTGTFSSVFGAGDVGKAVGTWGQPRKWFPGLNYNDFNFKRTVINGTPTLENRFKQMTYQFLPAHLTVTRTFDPCAEQQYCVSVTNDGDVDLYNVSVDSADNAYDYTIPVLAAGATDVHCFTTTSIPDGDVTASSNRMRIERNADDLATTDTNNLVNADGRAGIVTVGGDIQGVSATASPVQILATQSISGKVYCDENGNCTQDDGEAAAAGITVTLNPGNMQAVTDADGKYTFAGLLPGTYSVVVTVPGEYNATGSCAGVGGSIVSATEIQVATDLSGCEHPDNDFSLCLKKGDLCGYIYCDDNPQNGQQDLPDEPSLENVEVTLSNGMKAYTDADGRYCFLDLIPGNYSVSVPNTASNKLIIGANSQNVVVVEGPNQAQDFTYRGGLISGRLYCDENVNGQYDDGEQVYAGETVTLSDGKQTITDVNGEFSFSGCLDAGNYTITVPATAGGNPGLDGTTKNVSISEGGSSVNNNFRYECTEPPQGNGKICVQLKCVDKKCDKPDCPKHDRCNRNRCSHSHKCGKGEKCGHDEKCNKSEKCEKTRCNRNNKCDRGEKCDKDEKCNKSEKCERRGCNRGCGKCHDDRCGKCHDKNCGKCHDDRCGDCHNKGCNKCHRSQCGKCHDDRCGKCHDKNCGKCHDDRCDDCHVKNCTKCHRNDCGKCHDRYCDKHHRGEKCGKCDQAKGCKTDWTKVLVIVKDATGAVVSQAQANKDGLVCFDSLPAGTYTVCVNEDVAGLEVVGPACQDVTIADGESKLLEFGFKCGVIRGCAFTDKNCNGDKDDDEDCHKDVHICLKDKHGRTVKCTRTDKDGKYCFDGLGEGDYKVCAPRSSKGRNCRNSHEKDVKVGRGCKKEKQNFCYR